MYKIIDLFCGAGGTSLGFDRATDGEGRKIAEVVACVNHDADAIRSHSENFPNCRHYTEDVRTLDVSQLPRKKQGDGHRWILWASLECTHFSNAKSGARDADSRTLAYALEAYVDHVQPDAIMIENVREFMSWGDLCEKGKPIDRKKGTEYMRWRAMMEAKGYLYSSRLLNSADYGSHQSRLRYFGVFVRPDVPVVFPTPTHDKHGRLGLPRWKAVREVLELQDVGKSIFDRKKPLSDNTLRRILAGLVKFVATGQNQYIQKYYGGEGQVQGLDQPAPTVTTIDHSALVTTKPVFIQKYLSNPTGGVNQGASIDEPAPTVTTQRTPCLVSASFMTGYYGGHGAPEKVIASVDRPCPTLTTKDRYAVVSYIDNQFGNSSATSADEPVGTLKTVPKRNLVSAYLVNPQYDSKGSSLDAPCFTLIAKMDKMPPYIVTIDAEEAPKASRGTEYYKDNTVPPMERILTFMSEYGISDIFMRMLFVVELKRIQGLGDDYKLLGAQDKQKKFIGNAVVPDVVTAWIQALHTEMYNPQPSQLKMFG